MTPPSTVALQPIAASAMRRASPLIGLCLAGCLGLAPGRAVAADLALPPPPPIAMAPFAPLSWTGFYAGVQAGYDWNRDHLVEASTATGVPTGSVYKYNSDGFAGGAHVGVDYQMSSVVVGAVADFEGTTLRGTFVDPTGLGKGSDELQWQGSVRGRLGYAFDNILFYATGGFAYADLKNTYVYVPTGTAESFSNIITGWTAGGGIEYAFSDHWSMFGEYRYSDYGRFKNNSVLAFPGLSALQDYRSNAVKIGISYRF